jgi:hypothetical protein
MLTDEQIEAAKRSTPHTLDAHHEHNDCIRLAYEWLDAQKLLRAPNTKFRPLKHIIEKWAGRYVSQTDVEVAAALHPGIIGKYPNFNISSRMVRPNDRRLAGIGEALTQGYRDRINETTYAVTED